MPRTRWSLRRVRKVRRTSSKRRWLAISRSCPSGWVTCLCGSRTWRGASCATMIDRRPLRRRSSVCCDATGGWPAAMPCVTSTSSGWPKRGFRSTARWHSLGNPLADAERAHPHLQRQPPKQPEVALGGRPRPRPCGSGATVPAPYDLRVHILLASQTVLDERRHLRAQIVGEPAVSRDRKPQRSEERRVGKECRSRWSPYH